MGFAEQLAARAAEAKSSRENVSVASERSRKKKRRPRIQPIGDEEFGCDVGGGERGGDYVGRGGATSESVSVTEGSFADQLKRRAERTSIGSFTARQQDSVVSAISDCDSSPGTVVEDELEGDTLNASDHKSGLKVPGLSTGKDQMPSTESLKLNNPSQSIDTTDYLTLQKTWNNQLHSLHKSNEEERIKHHEFLRKQLNRPQVELAQRIFMDNLKEEQLNENELKLGDVGVHSMKKNQPDARAMHEMIRGNTQSFDQDDSAMHNMVKRKSSKLHQQKHELAQQAFTSNANLHQPDASAMHQMLKTNMQQSINHDANTMHQMLKAPQQPSNLHHQQTELQSIQTTTNKNEVFGAWAQIESLQLRLKEAEERANRECRRAELAELQSGGVVSDRNSSDGVSASGVVASHDAIKMRRDENAEEGYLGDLNALDESSNFSLKNQKQGSKTENTLHNENLEEMADPLAPPRLIQHPSNHISDNMELLQWKQRALQAEGLLSQQDYAALVSPHGTSTVASNQQFASPTKHNLHHPPPPPQSTVDSDMIQLKNQEINCLRHQISQLERTIQQQQQQSTNTYPAPPIAVAECTSIQQEENEEFHTLCKEIQQLNIIARSIRKKNDSNQSTIGSTLSSLGNEQEGDEEDGDDEEEMNGKSSWGLCCVRSGGRRRRGYYGSVSG